MRTDFLPLSNAALGALLGISGRRIAEVRGEGRLPLTPCGTRIDARALLRLGWTAALAGEADREEPPDLAFVLREAAIAAVLAGAEMGLRREVAERLADLVILFVLAAAAPEAEAAPDEVLSWREEVAWPALFGPDGASLVQGQLEAESRAELAEADTREPAGA
jgi:hypothetical protein